MKTIKERENMSISFSAHISNKKSAITGVSKLRGVANHNLRMFVSENPRSYCIRIIQGSDFLYRDVTDLYHSLFDEAQEEYNAKQTRLPDFFMITLIKK